MITLYQFNRLWGLPNASPFCMKLETYLRMTNLPYTIKYIQNPEHAPKKKLPFIKIDNKTYADSELIIDELKNRYGDAIDDGLTQEQKALAILIEHTFCERIYWLIVYMRWQNDSGWNQIKKAYFDHMPKLLSYFLPTLIRKNVVKSLYFQGTGRHTPDEIITMGRKTVDALVCILSKKPYFLGDKPTSIDATAFSFIANLILMPIDDPLKEYAIQITPLKDYCLRMWDEYYSDLEKPLLLKN